MQNPIRIYLMSFMMLLVTGSLFAQRGHGKVSPQDKAEKMTERLTETLSLDENQVEKVKTIHLKFAERMQAMHAQKDEGDRGAKREAMQKMRSDIDAEMKTVLTDKQYTTYQEMPKRRPGAHRKGTNGKRKGASHDKRKALHKDKIQPILLEQRAELENKISAEDKIAIAELRVDVKKEKEARKAERKEMKKSRKDGEAPDREAMKKRKEDRKNDPTRLKIMELTEKYKADMEPLLAEVEPQIKAIKEKAKADCGDDCKGKKRKHGGKKGANKEGKVKGENARHEKHQDKKYARFLMMDPNAADKQVAIEEVLISNVLVYPNPTQGISQIEYDLETEGKVTIELRDKEGNLLDTIESANKGAGHHKTAINFKNYTVGIYFIILKDKNGKTISKKVIR